MNGAHYLVVRSPALAASEQVAPSIARDADTRFVARASRISVSVVARSGVGQSARQFEMLAGAGRSLRDARNAGRLGPPRAAGT